MPPVDPDVLRLVASHGLADASVPDRLGPLRDDEVASLLLLSEQHRLVGLLGAAVDDGVFALTEPQHERVERMLQGWLAHALRVEAVLLDASAALARASIDHRVLKGVALAHTAYPNPAWRTFGDLDLLVPADQLSASAGVLTRALGAARVEPELRPGFDDRFGKEALLHGAHGVEVDVHRTFVDGALGLTIHFADLFCGGQPFSIGGRELVALPPAHQVLHAAYAVEVSDWPPRLASMRDLAQIMLTHAPEPAEVLDLARRWRATAVLAHALEVTWGELRVAGQPELTAWAMDFTPTRLERLLLASHRGRGRATTRHLAATIVLPDMADRAAYLRAVVWPQRSYLRARGFGRTRHVTRGLERLRRRPDNAGVSPPASRP